MSEAAYSPVDSWQPVNLATLEDTTTTPPDLVPFGTGQGLAYRGKRHLWTGEPESGKSWAALIACTLEILNERHVVFLDFESAPREALERMRSLAVTNMELGYFAYMQPADPIGAVGVSAFFDGLLEQLQPSLVVVDAYAGLLDLHELDPNSGADIERLNRVFFQPIHQRGIATITIDHLVKDKDRRGKYSIGSERKLGIVDVHLGFEVAVGKPMGRGRTGLVHVKTHKDRPGHMPRPRVCDIELRSDPESGVIDYTLKSPTKIDDDHPFRPTALMEKVSRYLEDRVDGPVLRSLIEQDVAGKTDYVRVAIDLLAKEQFVVESFGPKRGSFITRLYESARPYREQLDAEKNGVPG